MGMLDRLLGRNKIEALPDSVLLERIYEVILNEVVSLLHNNGVDPRQVDLRLLHVDIIAFVFSGYVLKPGNTNPDEMIRFVDAVVSSALKTIYPGMYSFQMSQVIEQWSVLIVKKQDRFIDFIVKKVMPFRDKISHQEIAYFFLGDIVAHRDQVDWWSLGRLLMSYHYDIIKAFTLNHALEIEAQNRKQPERPHVRVSYHAPSLPGPKIEMVKCPGCQSRVNADNQRCPFCGVLLFNPSKWNTPVATQSSDSEKNPPNLRIGAILDHVDFSRPGMKLSIEAGALNLYVVSNYFTNDELRNWLRGAIRHGLHVHAAIPWLLLEAEGLGCLTIPLNIYDVPKNARDNFLNGTSFNRVKSIAIVLGQLPLKTIVGLREINIDSYFINQLKAACSAQLAGYPNTQAVDKVVGQIEPQINVAALLYEADLERQPF